MKSGKLLNILIVIAFAAVLITVCSQSSPLYPLNTWNDSNCYYFESLSVASGVRPYVELDMQKGPIVTWLYMPAVLIGWTGIWLLEIIAAAAFLWFAYKTARLYIENNAHAYLLTALTGLITYASKSFSQGGSVEEFMLPLMAFGLYTLLACVKKEQRLPKWSSFFIGVCAGVCFMAKYTLCLFFAALAVSFVLLYIKKFKIKQIFADIWPALAGFAVVCAICLGVLAAIGVLPEFLHIYFFRNFTEYGTSSVPFMQRFIPSTIRACVKMLLFILITFAYALLTSAFKRLTDKKYANIALLITAIGLLCLTKPWEYYYIPLFAFIPYLLSGIAVSIDNKKFGTFFKQWFIWIPLCVIIVFSSFAFTPNRELMLTKKEDTLIARLAEPIKPGSKILIMSDTSAGIYVEANAKPAYKCYLYGNTINRETYDKYYQLIDERVPAYIVYRHAPDTEQWFPAGYHEASSFNACNVTDTDTNEYHFVVYERDTNS